MRAPLKRAAAPGSEAELLSRARALSGLTLGELSARLGAPMPDLTRAKGAIGTWVEAALGAEGGSRAERDFPALGVELKTIPVGADGTPRESTFVCVAQLERIADEAWEEAHVRHKLARVLWVPVEVRDDGDHAARRLGRPVLWSPSADEERVLRADWEHIVGLVARGHTDRITAHEGTYLQLRPKGAKGGDRVRTIDADGEWHVTQPKGFYLRTALTGRIVAQAV